MNLMQLISLDRLAAHPANANRMSKANFARLVSHIKRTGRYEPIVVRPHGRRQNCYQILNGHHRVKALKQLAYSEADCVVWQVDDGEAEILLATLNRLAGKDELHKKSELIKSLSARFSVRELARMLPDSKRHIERLKDLHAKFEMPNRRYEFNPEVFFLTDEQKAIVDKALRLADDGNIIEGSAKRRAESLTKIAKFYTKEVN